MKAKNPKKKNLTLEERCVLCREVLAAATLSKDLVLKTCPNKNCSRFGLITVIFLRLAPAKSKIITNEKIKKGKHS